MSFGKIDRKLLLTIFGLVTRSFCLFLCLIYRKVLPPQTGELNVHFGVFFGGLGDFSEPYVNAVDNFRGCMSDVRIQIVAVVVVHS